MRRIAGWPLVLAMIAAAACSSPAPDGSGEVAQDAPTTTTTAATTTEPPTSTTEGDIEIAELIQSELASLQPLVREWNDNQIEWIAALQDPDVSLEEFLRVQQDVLTRQGAVAAEMSAAATQATVLGDVLQPIADHYAERVLLLRPLFSAAAGGTEDEFAGALSSYQGLTLESLPLLEAIFSHPDVVAAAEADGVGADGLRAALDSLKKAAGIP